MNEIKKPTFILGETVKQAECYIKSNGLERRDTIALYSKEQLFGLRNCKLIKVRTWYRNHNVEELLDMAALSGFTIIDDSQRR